MLDGKTVLITGGTGSLGKVLVERLLGGQFGQPAKLVVFSRDEAKQAEMRRHCARRLAAHASRSAQVDEVLDFRIGDIRDLRDVCGALRGADIVINAAALKQVPSCEYFPDQAVMTNVLGAQNIVHAVLSRDCPVKTVVGISTDKACKPVSAMGMSKALQERIFAAANLHTSDTRFISVRYGNVLASRGSVVPLFLDQIRRGAAVTVTVPEMTRFVLTLDQAVDAVMAAIRVALPGETLVPRAPSATVMNIARGLIGQRDVPISVVGARPGEKLHEVLVSSEEVPRCVDRGGFLCIKSMLPELGGEDGSGPPALSREYTSADQVMDFASTLKILRANRLTPRHVRQPEPEVLR